VQIVFQNPYGSLNPRQKVGAVLEEPLIINHSEMSAGERRDRAMEMLLKVGLQPEHFGRYPHMFSGGQRQRIAIGRALMLNPKILVLDEPVSALDLSIQAQILNLLKDLQDEFNLSYLFISHDLGVVRHVCDEVAVMYLGKIVESGPTQALFEDPQHPYTQALLSAAPSLARRKSKGYVRPLKVSGDPPSPINPPKGCAFAERCPRAAEICRNTPPDLKAIGLHATACHFPGPAVSS